MPCKITKISLFLVLTNTLLTVTALWANLPIFASNYPHLELARTIPEVSPLIERWKRGTGSRGFVPTMGSLHEGHISLIRKSLEENDFSVVSIFVNPTQFNDKKDFESYPRNLADDLEFLKSWPVDVVFAPGEREIYPEPDERVFEFGGLDLTMEGKYRPGHFNGVAQVVSRFFSILEPDVAYFGEKDFQQLAIIRRMVSQLELPVRITGCPIIREPDGLAMSSRNRLLSPGQRISAARIHQALARAKEKAGTVPVKALIRETIDFIQDDPNLRVEYFEIVNDASLEAVSGWSDPGGKRGCLAVYAGRVRLIDNMDFSL
jgi:pantoate--beta-alanine ligase